MSKNLLSRLRRAIPSASVENFVTEVCCSVLETSETATGALFQRIPGMQNDTPISWKTQQNLKHGDEVSRPDMICECSNTVLLFEHKVEAPVDAQWSREVSPDSTLLFRYSALTFNGHRIHYDLDFCRHEEGYPGLVIHGPLTATMLLELALAQNPELPLETYEFRAFSPLFDNSAFTLNGKMENGKAIIWAANPHNGLAMKANLSFAD